MQYLYHRRSPDFRGTTIYPLNVLRAKFPDLHETEVSKYAGRQQITEETVPILDVLWNDVVHSAPIDPRLIYQALRDLGGSPEPQEYFKIPVSRITGLRAVWFDPQNERYPFPARSEDVRLIVPDTFEQLSAVPERTLGYYRACLRKGQQPPLLFLYVPHVLIHGAIDVTDVDVIDWSS